MGEKQPGYEDLSVIDNFNNLGCFRISSIITLSVSLTIKNEFNWDEFVG